VRIIVLGAPGSGKGSQARLLATRLGVAHLSVGALLRAEIERRSPLGARIAADVAAGELVPMADVLAVLEVPLTAATQSGGWVLDGVPRTVDQAAALDGMLDATGAPVRIVVALEVPDVDIRARLERRARVEHRADDTSDVIAHRLAVWAQEGPPLLAWYERQGRLARIDGTGDVASVAVRVADEVDRSRPDRVT
jgi:adenylate kinase